MRSRVGIVAALPREIRWLTRSWTQERDVSDQGLKIFTNERGIAVCGGMGTERVRLAALAALSLGPVHRLLSVGWAGGLRPGMTSGVVDRPGKVIDAATGEAYETGETGGTLVSVNKPADVEAKRRLAEEHDADLVDMEAATVAGLARGKGISFLAIKALSDEYDFELPGLERFIAGDGQFREGAFAAHVAIRPWLWKNVFDMARSSEAAAKNLCREIEEYLADEVGEFS